jgi:hypothetical protein
VYCQQLRHYTHLGVFYEMFIFGTRNLFPFGGKSILNTLTLPSPIKGEGGF